jgi:hypothetical protein
VNIVIEVPAAQSMLEQAHARARRARRNETSLPSPVPLLLQYCIVELAGKGALEKQFCKASITKYVGVGRLDGSETRRKSDSRIQPHHSATVTIPSQQTLDSTRNI